MQGIGKRDQTYAYLELLKKKTLNPNQILKDIIQENCPEIKHIY